MVEKAGHKKALVTARNDWINEGRPKASHDDDDELGIGAVTIDDDDLYGATPRGARRFVNMLRDAPVPAPPANNDMPDDDDLEALMAETERMVRGKLLTARPDTTKRISTTASANFPDDDDLEALMAEAESMDTANTTATTTKKQNTTTSANGPEEDDDYLEALIAEAEAQDRQQPAAKKAGDGLASADKGHDFADEEEAMREMDGLW